VSMIKEFMEFLNEYKVIGLAIAFILGAAATSLVKSLVNDIIMPIITVFLPAGSWKTATFALGPIVIGWGAFLSELINFIIIAFVVFLIAKKILRKRRSPEGREGQKVGGTRGGLPSPTSREAGPCISQRSPGTRGLGPGDKKAPDADLQDVSCPLMTPWHWNRRLPGH